MQKLGYTPWWKRWKWFGHVRRRRVETSVMMVDQMGDSPLARRRVRPRKIIGQTIN